MQLSWFEVKIDSASSNLLTFLSGLSLSCLCWALWSILSQLGFY